MIGSEPLYAYPGVSDGEDRKTASPGQREPHAPDRIDALAGTRALPDWVSRMEFYALCGVLLVIPLWESPKSVLLGLALLIRLGRLIWERRLFSRPPDRVEILLLGLAGVALLSTLVNLPYPHGFRGFLDTGRNLVLCWLLYSHPLSRPRTLALALCAIAGTLLADLYALWELHGGARTALELHSVGIVTHSALYQGMVALLACGFLLDALGRQAGPWVVLGWGLVSLALILILFLMGSRGAILALLLSLGVLLLIFRQRRVLALAALALGFGLLAASLSTQNPYLNVMREKLAQWEQGQLPVPDQVRIAIWRVALKQIQAGDSPWLGLGPRNFGSIPVERFHFDPPLPEGISYQNHAHNLLLNKLVEEGLLGLAVFLAFLGLVSARLVRVLRMGTPDWRWVGAFGALMVPVVGGLFNTPFYHEHALLAMALMALFLRDLRPWRSAA